MKFPGKMVNVNHKDSVIMLTVSCLVKGRVIGSVYKLPRKEDVLDYNIQNIERISMTIVYPGNARNIYFCVPELNDIWGAPI